MGSMPTGMRRTAELSRCGRFRYQLGRDWSSELFPARMEGSVLWIMLNPSLADGEGDDPTIRRIVNFTRSWGYNRLDVVNLYAWRGSDPSQMRYVPDRDGGTINDAIIQRLSGEAPLIVAAWGAHAERSRVKRVVDIVRRPMVCLGTTADGFPCHPLYRPAATVPCPFDPQVYDG